MAQNIEIKARLTTQQFRELESRVAAIVDRDCVLHQTDTFFHTTKDRLKLREYPDQPAELIAYQRTDQNEPKLSDYIRTPVDQPDSLKLALMRSLGIRGVIKKRRDLYLVGQTRVHLDLVDGLGEFVELEVVMRPDQLKDDGLTIVNELMEQLGIEPGCLISAAYIDLLETEELVESQT